MLLIFYCFSFFFYRHMFVSDSYRTKNSYDTNIKLPALYQNVLSMVVFRLYIILNKFSSHELLPQQKHFLHIIRISINIACRVTNNNHNKMCINNFYYII